MKKHLNTLYITLEGAYLHKEGETIEVRHGGETKIRVPLHNLEAVVAFGWDIIASAALMHGCAKAGVSLSFLSPTGRFLASSYGGVSGNVLLRKNQYLASENLNHCLSIAQNLVAAKICNSRNVIQRAARDYGEQIPDKAAELLRMSDYLQHRIRMASNSRDIDALRGIEGEAAALYFSAFPHLFTSPNPTFHFDGRTRNPPMDPFNALISLLYVLLMHDCKSACESVGLDPQCGFLHKDRPGRFSLALDLAEEFRAYFCDRLAFNLVNRNQLSIGDFETNETGAVLLTDEGRKKVLMAWQTRKQDEVTHPFIDEKTTIGLLPHIQARLLARHLRGDIDAYPAFLWR